MALVIDLSDEASPAVVASVFIPDATTQAFENPGIDLVGDLACVAAQSGLYVFDISNPLNPLVVVDPNDPEFASFRFPPEFIQSRGGRVLVRGNLAYVTSSYDQNTSNRNGGLAIYKLFEEATNQPPVAGAGQDKTIECSGPDGAMITLDGSGSSDPDSTPGTNDDIISFEWFEDGVLLGQGEMLDHTFSLGIHNVVLVVTDSAGETDSNEVIITVQDTIPPQVSVSVKKDSLWPPNHKMVDVGFIYDVTDSCDSNVEVSLDVTSDEPTATAPGAGGPKHAPDAEIEGDGAVLLRTERSGKGDGRVYEITVTATDASGNSASPSTSVKVNKSKKKEAVDSGQNYDATQIN